MTKSRSVCREFPHVSKCLDEKILSRRKEMHLSQSALAARAGLTRNCIQQMECYEHLPLPSTMFKLIQALEFSDEETARFWEELEEAYHQDRVLQEAKAETPQKV